MVGKATPWVLWGDKVGALSSSAWLLHRAYHTPLRDLEINETLAPFFPFEVSQLKPQLRVRQFHIMGPSQQGHSGSCAEGRVPPGTANHWLLCWAFQQSCLILFSSCTEAQGPPLLTPPQGTDLGSLSKPHVLTPSTQVWAHL